MGTTIMALSKYQPICKLPSKFRKQTRCFSFPILVRWWWRRGVEVKGRELLWRWWWRRKIVVKAGQHGRNHGRRGKAASKRRRKHVGRRRQHAGCRHHSLLRDRTFRAGCGRALEGRRRALEHPFHRSSAGGRGRRRKIAGSRNVSSLDRYSNCRRRRNYEIETSIILAKVFENNRDEFNQQQPAQSLPPAGTGAEEGGGGGGGACPKLTAGKEFGGGVGAANKTMNKKTKSALRLFVPADEGGGGGGGKEPPGGCGGGAAVAAAGAPGVTLFSATMRVELRVLMLTTPSAMRPSPMNFFFTSSSGG
jgi:hypothetical protein